MTQAPTKRQADVLTAIASLMEELGRSPSGPEIGDMLGMNHASSVYQHLDELERKGHIEIIRSEGKKANAIRLLGPAKSLLRVGWPLLGAIPAGPLSEITSEDTTYIEGIDDLVPGVRKGDFFLEVEGDSMIDAGLEPGMLVHCRPDAYVTPGSVCAVWVEGEGGTLKAVHPQGTKVRLQPANSRYEPRVLNADQVQVRGVVIQSVGVRPIKVVP